MPSRQCLGIRFLSWVESQMSGSGREKGVVINVVVVYLKQNNFAPSNGVACILKYFILVHFRSVLSSLGLEKAFNASVRW